jgi:hypothetical protein
VPFFVLSAFRFPHNSRDPEIRDLHHTCFIDEQILRLDVAMHDAVIVRTLQRFADDAWWCLVGYGPASHHYFFGTDGLPRDHSGESWRVIVRGFGEGADAEDDQADGGFLLIAAPHAAMTLRVAEAGYVAARHAAPLRGGGADVCDDE